jgi:two-component system, LytTR family, response regulator
MYMEKIRVVLADDDVSSRFILSHFTQLLSDYDVVGEAGSGEELIQLVMKEKPDIALVDINMPNISGMEAIKACNEIYPSLQVIFTTGHDEFAVEAFNLAAVDYIVKPIERVRLFVGLEKAKKMIQLQKKQEEIVKKGINKLAIKSNNSFLYLSTKDILYIEKEGRKSIVHTYKHRFETTESLQELEERLPEYFYKTHRSYIVNLKKIEKIESFGETFLAYFSSEDKVAHISKLKINEVFELIEK